MLYQLSYDGLDDYYSQIQVIYNLRGRGMVHMVHNPDWGKVQNEVRMKSIIKAAHSKTSDHRPLTKPTTKSTTHLKPATKSSATHLPAHPNMPIIPTMSLQDAIDLVASEQEAYARMETSANAAATVLSTPKFEEEEERDARNTLIKIRTYREGVQSDIAEANAIIAAAYMKEFAANAAKKKTPLAVRTAGKVRSKETQSRLDRRRRNEV